VQNLQGVEEISEEGGRTSKKRKSRDSMTRSGADRIMDE